jgi:hypothetical protein
MSLDGDRSDAGVRLLRLDDERRRAVAAASPEGSGRTARTLVKDGPLRVTLIELAPGEAIAEHRAEGFLLTLSLA